MGQSPEMRQLSRGRKEQQRNDEERNLGMQCIPQFTASLFIS